MHDAKWSSYLIVEPPVIDSSFFSVKPLELDISYNPIALAYTEYISTKEDNDDNITHDVIEPIEKVKPKKKKKADKKKEEASRIVKAKTSQTKTKIKFSSNLEFAKILNSLYRKELSKRGLDPSLSTMLVAQDANECGWGKYTIGKFNFGNITTTGNDWTKRSGNNKWKDFDSIEDYVSYKIDFLSNNRYLFFKYANLNNIATSMQTLANRGYAPDNSRYGLNVYNTYKTVLKYLNNA